MTTEKVTKLHPGEKYYAKCPDCGGTSWGLLLNGLGDGWDKITGTECLNPDCGLELDWIQVDREEKSPRSKNLKETEKVVHIRDGLGSIKHLQGLIEGIRAEKVSKFICIDQCELVVPKDCKVVDAHGEELNIGEEFSANSYYFFGDCPTSQLLGLLTRMTHKLNQSMDGIDIFGDSSIEEE